ncbi:MAG TPA: hypothetical protein VIX58_10125 [Anaerolineae bacterium]
MEAMNAAFKKLFGQRPNYLLVAIAGASLAVLVVELILVAPRALEAWHPYDYGQYLEMGAAARQGINPVGPRHYYPLPTILWLFVPLSLMPDWFRLVWVILPFIFILRLFRRSSLWLLFFTPLWFAVGDGMIDPWLIVPVTWVSENRPTRAALGAVLLLMKPQVALLLVAYRLGYWVYTRDKRNLMTFILALAVFCLPAFVFDPLWIPHLLTVLPLRVSETTAWVPLMTSTIWAWWHLGDIGIWIFAALLVAFAILSWRAWSHESQRAAALFQILNQAFVPVLYASNLVTLLPVMRNRKILPFIVALSLGAMLLDRIMNTFGGGYVLIPLVMVYFSGRGISYEA